MPPGYFILKASVTEAALLSKLARETFYQAYHDKTDVAEMEIFLAQKYNLENCLKELSNPAMEFYIVFDMDADVGYFMLDKERKPDEFKNVNCIELSRIYARKEYWGKKVGKLMIDQAISFARRREYDSIWLQVWDENQRALEFYKRNGFELTNIKLPYQMNNRVDWDLVMVKNLKLPKLPDIDE